MRQLLAAFLLAVAVGPLAAQPVGTRELDAARRSVSKPLLVESYGQATLQSGELRLPAGEGPHPVAVVIHGGCWLSSMEDRSGIAPLADALSKRGFATWTIGYRRVGDAGGGWPGTFEDVAVGTDHLQALARVYRLDLGRVAIVGHSSGAHLALWVASRGKLGNPWTPKVVPSVVVAIDGPAALAPLVGADAEECGRPVIVPLMGGTPAERPAEYRLASPAAQLPLGVRQLLVFGVFQQMMRPYAAAARAAGDPVEILQPPGANHFDIITPAQANGEAVANFIAARAFPK